MRRGNKRAHHGAPISHVQAVYVQAQLLKDVDIQILVREIKRHLVDRVGNILFLNHQVLVHVAEESHLFTVLIGQAVLTPADKNIRNNTNRPQDTYGLLRGLGFHFTRSLDIRHEGNVKEQTVLAADFLPELANSLQERQGFNVARCSAYFRDQDVHIRTRQGADSTFDFVGNVRNHLNCFTEVPALALAGDNGAVDAAGREVTGPRARNSGEAFVMPEIEIGFGPVVGDVNLSMLVRGHGPGIHVKVRIHFLKPHPVSAPLKQERDRGGGEPLPQRRHNAACHKNMFRH